MAEEIHPDVYDLTLTPDGERRLRAFLFDADRPTLVDAGLEATADELFAELADVTAPERVVVTHGDPDHVGGLPAVVEEFDPDVYLPAETSYDGPGRVERFGDGDTVGPFEAVHLPGHEPDNYGLVDERRGVVVAGDAVSGSDQRGLPAGYPVLPPAVYSRDLNRAEESLERLLEYEFDVLLVFHGSSIHTGAKAKLDRFVNFPGKP